MTENFKYTKEMIEWRRNTVMSRLVQGHSQSDIAKELKLHPSTISLDVQFLKEKSKRELETHFSEGLPFIYSKSMQGIHNVLRKVSEILDSAIDNKTKMDCLRLQAELYRLMLVAGTDGSVIQKAMDMVKIIAPLPGEEIKIPTVSDEELEKEESEEESTEETTAEAEAEEDLKEE